MKIDEKMIAKIWSGQRNDTEYAWKNNKIVLVYPGRPCSNSGCDFDDAVFMINAKRQTGKVELHVKAEDWYRHRHHYDKRYDDILLHVVSDISNKDTVTSKGKIIPTISLDIDDKKIYGMLYGDVLTEKQMSFRCQAAGLHSEKEMHESIIEEGYKRFQDKVRKINTYLRIDRPENVLYRFLSRSFGYSANSVPFERLTEIFPLEYVTHMVIRQDKKLLLANIMWTAGLLPSQRKRLRKYSQPDRESVLLENIAAKMNNAGRMYESDWKFYPVRPQNNPVRRLVAFSGIMYRLVEKGFTSQLIDMFSGPPRKEWITAICDEFNMKNSDSYWERHFDFGIEINKRIDLLGPGKISDIVVNTLLPFMYAYGQALGNRKISINSKYLYSNFPGGSENQIVRYMQQFTGYGKISRSIEQQGLIEVYNNYCKTKLCDLCPLFSRKN